VKGPFGALSRFDVTPLDGAIANRLPVTRTGHAAGPDKDDLSNWLGALKPTPPRRLGVGSGWSLCDPFAFVIPKQKRGLLGFLWVVRGAEAGVKGVRRAVVTDP
jgi:hypothetical protein